MDPSTVVLYAFQSPLYFENIDRYQPTDEYFLTVSRLLPKAWSIKRQGFWTQCFPPDWQMPKRGWKIHISSVLLQAEETLSTVATLLAENGIAFKFASDPRMLRISLGKTWSRLQVGKFIAIYPRDEEQFKRIAEALHHATSHLVGPHVLTDRAYKDSRVVYYRYGAFISEYRVDPYGFRTAGITLEDGSWYEDLRGPTFHLPEGIVDPLAPPVEPAASAPAAAPKEVLLADRYLVRGVIKFSASGGIYLGIDKQDGRAVVIREIRGELGHLESEMPDDPAFVIKREARILQRLAPTGAVPVFIDLFKEWNNWFLVEEKLDASSLWYRSMDMFFSDESQSASAGFENMLATVEQIAAALQAVHERGVVLRDLTKTNVLFTTQGEVKFIDLEFAYELDDTTPWVKGFTPGYASAEQIGQQRPKPADDCYALGALILDMVTFCSAGLDLNREAIFRKLKQNLSDMNLPAQIFDMVEGLMEPDTERRWTVPRLRAFLRDIPSVAAGDISMFASREAWLDVPVATPALIEKLHQIERGFVRYCDNTIDLSRKDRLWPCSAEAYVTNGISLQHGASGVAFYLLRNREHVSHAVLDWIEARGLSQTCPGGLYAGTGGVALLLFWAGREDAARRMLEVACSEPAMRSQPGLYYGIAGLGLIYLHAWRCTGKTVYLERAIDIGQQLLERAKTAEHGLYWPVNGKIHLGLGEGQSGIALFLTYLAAASGEAVFEEAAGKALDADLAHGIRLGGKSLWKTHSQAKSSEPNLPHTRHGSAGIGTACIRYFALTGKTRYRDAALDCAYSISSRITNKIWQDSGNAGFGEFMLDMAHFLSDIRFEHLAYYHAEAIVPHALVYPEGTAFAGQDHFRICNDYSYGGAGIGVFIDRLLHRKPRFLMLDELLSGHLHSASARSTLTIEA